jgi:hypothetical protein
LLGLPNRSGRQIKSEDVASSCLQVARNMTRSRADVADSTATPCLGGKTTQQFPIQWFSVQLMKEPFRVLVRDLIVILLNGLNAIVTHQCLPFNRSFQTDTAETGPVPYRRPTMLSRAARSKPAAMRRLEGNAFRIAPVYFGANNARLFVVDQTAAANLQAFKIGTRI